ncbi:MAG: FG-GAP-like repeat-containing protein [Bacteroidota bacterium]
MRKIRLIHNKCPLYSLGLKAITSQIKIIAKLFILIKTCSLTRILTSALFLMFALNVAGQNPSFRKLNSGTKADIRSIKLDEKKNVYFLTDKIYKVDNAAWKKLDFPVGGKINTFYPASPQDIWFTIDQVTNTSMLYHYHDNITENVRSPFSNQILSINFISEKTALFAGNAEIAIYQNGTFTMIPPPTASFFIVKVFSQNISAFWILTHTGELFFYEKGIYKKVLDNKFVVDFCFLDTRSGYLLTMDGLYYLDGSTIKLLVKDSDLKHVRKMCLLHNGTILMAGEKGWILSYTDGHLQRFKTDCTENFSDMVATDTDNIWICGENGRLLYMGAKKFPEYSDDNQGFSSHKLISYYIRTDDEYGVALADFSGDNKTDIYIVRIYEQNRLYINNISTPNLLTGTNGFTEEAAKRNANGSVHPEKVTSQNELKLGISAVDIDNDNDQDIYICYLNSTNKLLINKGNGYFRNVSAEKQRACENMKRSNAAAFADVDNDGDLDLFVTNEEGSNRLFENNGTGHFRDITLTSGLYSSSGGMCASFADVNSDGLPDLCVSFWSPANKLYINESIKGRIHFRDGTQLTDIVRATPSKSNAVVFADVNNDGFNDLFIANRNTGNKLYLNNGKGIFTDKTRQYFEPENYLTNGAVFADFDLDGYLDLYITNVGENVLYKNMGGKCFKDVTSVFGAELSGYSTGCAVGDIDNDGDPDLYVANYVNGDSKLFMNITGKKTFVKFKLKGVRSNKDAIGTKVWLYSKVDNQPKGTLAGYREMNGGGGYGSVSAKEMIFGVDPSARYYALVKFPSSPDTIRIDQLHAGETYNIMELTGFAAFYYESTQRLLNFLRNQEYQPEIIKYLIIILLLLSYNLQRGKSIRNIRIIRWLVSVLVFTVFVFVNQLLLFQWVSILFFVPPLIVFCLMALLHLYVERIWLKRLAQKEKLDLREKLSRDLHDDLASTLGSISIYAETLKSLLEPSQSDFKKLSIKIAGLTQSALQSISDIIWMTSPRNDSIQSLISKISNYMLEILTDNKINFNTVIEIPDDPVLVGENIRNDAFLILKEAVYNIIRHSEAGNVSFTAKLKDNRCTICLKDDGVGFSKTRNLTKESHGNGLGNMRRRALESGIDLSLKTVEGEGAEITMLFEI